MPFTLAHPIAAAPIWLGSKRRLDLPSLMIGSMIPDLGYFLALQPIKTIGHTLPGIFIPGVPYSIVLLLIIRYILLRPCLAFLPLQISRYFPSPKSYFPLKLSHLFNVVISVIIGAISHLIWDAFTHSTGWIVTYSPLLSSEFQSVSLYKILQYGSSLIGLIGLGLWLFKWLDRTEYRHRAETLTPNWRGLATIEIVLAGFGLAIVAIEINHVIGETFAEVFVRALIGCISGTFLGLLIYSLGFWILDRLKPGTMTIYSNPK